MQSQELIDSLIEQTEQTISKAQELSEKDVTYLTWRENNARWNILECLEHLNRYGYFYLPEIERAIKSSNTKSQSKFSSGLLGNYFAKSMLPNGKLNKMVTFKDKDPIHANLDQQVIDTFIEQQHRYWTNPVK